MADDNTYHHYQAPSGTPSSTPVTAPASQGYGYLGQPPYAGSTYVPEPGQQYWALTQAQPYNMAPDVNVAYPYGSGPGFPAGQGANSEGSFQAPRGTVTYGNGQPPSTSRRPSGQMNCATNVYSATVRSTEMPDGDPIPSETSAGYPAASRPPVVQGGQGTHARSSTIYCKRCGSAGGTDELSRIYAQGNTQATVHICGHCIQFYTAQHRTSAGTPSGTPTPIPSSTDGGSQRAPGIQTSTPSSPREQAEQSVVCSKCDKVLKGPYASGNLTRHHKSRSCAASRNRRPFLCDFEGCSNQYERSDALLNHKRKKHGAPGPSKPPRRYQQGTSAK